MRLGNIARRELDNRRRLHDDGQLWIGDSDGKLNFNQFIKFSSLESDEDYDPDTDYQIRLRSYNDPLEFDSEAE